VAKEEAGETTCARCIYKQDKGPAPSLANPL
jgi:hypothetical protein